MQKVQYGSLQSRNTFNSAFRWDRNKISMVKPIFSRFSYRMGLVQILSTKPDVENSTRRLFLLQLGENMLMPLLQNWALNTNVCGRPQIGRALTSVSVRLIDLRPCQHDNGYMDGRSQIKVHNDERTQVHSAQSSVAVTHPSTNRARVWASNDANPVKRNKGVLSQKRARCIRCPSEKEQKVTTRCCKCELFVCGEHSLKSISISCIECQRWTTACDEGDEGLAVWISFLSNLESEL